MHPSFPGALSGNANRSSGALLDSGFWITLLDLRSSGALLDNASGNHDAMRRRGKASERYGGALIKLAGGLGSGGALLGKVALW